MAVATLPTKDELKSIGEHLTALLVHYQATEIKIFTRVINMNDKRLVIIFFDQYGKLLAEREFPQS